MSAAAGTGPRGTRTPREGRGARALGAGMLVLTLGGCSEKPVPPIMVWDFATGLANRRAALTAVVAPPGGPVLAIGYDRPEGRVANTPLCFQHVGRAWTPVPMSPASMGASTVLRNATLADDGTVWACGRTVDYEPEPSLILPVLYHYASGVWTEFPISGAGDLSGVDLFDLEAHGSGTGAGLVLRVVGASAAGTAGAAITYSGGRWSRDSIPAPPAVGGLPWWLATIARGIDGKWYAAGARFDIPGGAVYVDDGVHGWTLLPGPAGYPGMQFSALAFDPEGYAWLAGNYTIGDSLQGVLFRGSSGSFTPAAIARRSSGGFQIHCIGFDGFGHGWLAGRRSGLQPFIAGTSGRSWNEVLTQVEPGELVGGETFISGNTIHGGCAVGAQSGYAVGYAEVLDFEGLSENEAFIYEFIPRPPGEIDRARPDPGPLRATSPVR